VAGKFEIDVLGTAAVAVAALPVSAPPFDELNEQARPVTRMRIRKKKVARRLVVIEVSF
jgi:hypothetical protein